MRCSRAPGRSSAKSIPPIFSSTVEDPMKWCAQVQALRFSAFSTAGLGAGCAATGACFWSCSGGVFASEYRESPAPSQSGTYGAFANNFCKTDFPTSVAPIGTTAGWTSKRSHYIAVFSILSDPVKVKIKRQNWFFAHKCISLGKYVKITTVLVGSHSQINRV